MIGSEAGLAAGKVLAINQSEKLLFMAFDENAVSSQGSEFPAVVVPVLNSHPIMLQGNPLYTAITRAQRLVVLAGDPKAIAVAVRNDKVLRRYTALAARLGQACNADANNAGCSLTYEIH